MGSTAEKVGELCSSATIATIEYNDGCMYVYFMDGSGVVFDATEQSVTVMDMNETNGE